MGLGVSGRAAWHHDFAGMLTSLTPFGVQGGGNSLLYKLTSSIPGTRAYKVSRGYL